MLPDERSRGNDRTGNQGQGRQDPIGVGKMLTKLAAGTMKRVSMELSVNDPFIVFDDADLDVTGE